MMIAQKRSAGPQTGKAPAGEHLLDVRKVLSDAMTDHWSGNAAAAEDGYRRVLNQNYRPIDVLPLLAKLLSNRGEIQDSLRHWDRLLALDPRHLSGLLEKGLLLHRANKLALAVDCFARAKAVAPDNALVMTNLAVALADVGRRNEALTEFQRVLELEPNNLHVQHQVRRLSSLIVPSWHVPMMNDTPRNDAFEKAIVAAVAQHGDHARVLEIGTGSGLLAMMAARSGAKRVVTCESVPVIAETAERIVEHNGYGQNVRVVNKPSNELNVGEDLDERADILISEILSCDLLGEKVLDTFEDAHARLLRHNATVIPRAATAVGCLVASDVLARHAFVSEVSGFDLSPFNALANQHLPVHGTMTSWRRLSGDFDLVTLDLTAKRHEGALRKQSVPVLEDGVAVGIVQWMRVDLAEGVTFDNHPDTYADGGWLQVLHSFPQPIDVKAGDQLELVIGHDRSSLIVVPAPQDE
jgi:tetratricopeptide (TPR) repeat protein